MPDYFTLAELRALPDMSDAVKYPDAAVELAADYIVDVIERVVGTSFVGRSVTETHDGLGRYGIPVRRPFVLSVTSAAENGVAVTPVPVDLDGTGVLYKYAAGATSPTPWVSGRANVVITYVSGYSLLADIPGDIKEAALQGTRSRLLSTRGSAGQHTRRTRLTTEAGVFDLATAGKEAPTGYPEVDAVILGWADRLDTLGFA